MIHDGVDTSRITPGPATFFHPQIGRVLTSEDEIITYVARNLEPYRGFHIFMRALGRILRERPKAHICIVGDTGVSYGAAPEDGGTWKDKLLAEIGTSTDLSHVHFLGWLPHDQFIALLRLSRAHVYLTYPFVLSWSLLEAMSIGCVVIASDTAPVREVIDHGKNGLLVPFFDPAALADCVAAVAREPHRYVDLRRQARATVVQDYDFESVSWPRFSALISDLAVPELTSEPLNDPRHAVRFRAESFQALQTRSTAAALFNKERQLAPQSARSL